MIFTTAFIIPLSVFSAPQPTVSGVTVPGVLRVLPTYCFDTTGIFTPSTSNYEPVVKIVAKNSAKTRMVISSVELADTSDIVRSNNAAFGGDELAASFFTFVFRNFRVSVEDMQKVSCVIAKVIDYGGNDPTGFLTVSNVSLSFNRQSGDSCVIPDLLPLVPEKRPDTFSKIDAVQRAPIARSGGGGACSATTVGPNAGSSFTQDATGTTGWGTMSDAISKNSVYASVSVVNSNITSHNLKIEGFGFSVPSGATINGITATVTLSKSSSFGTVTVTDNSIRLIKADVITGSDYKRGSGSVWTTTDTDIVYGGSTDLWGTTLTSSDVNDSGFGVAVSASLNTGGSGTGSARVDFVSITVDYTPLTCGSIYDAFIDLMKVLSDKLFCLITRSCVR